MSDATTARRREIIPNNVLIEMKKGKGNTMHIQRTQKRPHPRRRQKTQRMKNMYLFQHSQVLSLKGVIFGLWIAVLPST